MKNKILFLLALGLFVITSFCFGKTKTEIHFSKTESLLEHLQEVNPQWKFQKNLPTFFQKKISFQNDIQRIQLHLFIVQHFLKNKNTSPLSFSQKNNRAKFLKILHQYAMEGVFPKNTYHKKRAPYFVDNEGVRCAVGYLIDKSGETELVKTIHSENNYKYIFELQLRYPQLENWATENGFTVEELAWIQPGYCSREYYYGLGNGGGPNGKINTMQVTPDSNLLVIGGGFSNIDGVQAGGVVGWDGNQWVTFGDGVDGEVHCMTYHKDQLFIGGKFKLQGEDDFTNVAFWNGNNWAGWKMESEGNVLALQSYHGRLHAGGDFQMVNGDTMLHLAFYDEAEQEWSNNGLAYLNGQLVEQTGMFAVDEVVRSFVVWNDLLYVGGDFRQTSPNVSNPNVIQYDVRSLAIWFDYLWIDEEDAMYRIFAMDTIGDALILMGQTENKESIISLKKTGNWESVVTTIPDENAIINGAIIHHDSTFLFGNPAATRGNGVLFFYKDDLSIDYYFPCDEFNDEIYAGAFFKENYYFAGAFTAIHFLNYPSESFNNIVFTNYQKTQQDVFVKNENLINIFSEIEIQNANRTIFVSYENLKTDTELLIFNLNGQRIKTLNLERGNQEYIFDILDVPSGCYFFQVKNQDFQQTGKFSFF